MKIAIVAPMDPRTGISNYSETLAIELLKLGEEVDIVSPENTSNPFLTEHVKMRNVAPENFNDQDYDIIHFQLANSPLQEFQLHILEDKHKTLKTNPNIITTVHDARNFDTFDPTCVKCLSFTRHYLNSPLTYPYDIVDRGFQRISKYLIFHNHSASEEYKNRYKLGDNVIRCIPHPAYRLAGSHAVDSVRRISDENRFLVPGYISPFKGQDLLIKAVSEVDEKIKLIFMGGIVDEGYGNYLHELVEQEDVGDKVEFLGFVSADQFIEEFDKSKVVMVPRLTSSWLKEKTMYKLRKILGLDYLINQSTSGVLTKALASGKPIICSKSQGFADYVNFSRGILCEDKIESWRNAMNYMLQNTDKIEQMAMNSREYAMKTLNPKLIAKKHLNLYKECSEI